MPKSPRKKNQVSTWFNGILKETVRGDIVSEEIVIVQQQVRSATREYRVPECTGYQSVTVDVLVKSRISEHRKHEGNGKRVQSTRMYSVPAECNSGQF